MEPVKTSDIPSKDISKVQATSHPPVSFLSGVQAKVNTHDSLVVRLLLRLAYSRYGYVCKILSEEINDSYLILSYLIS